MWDRALSPGISADIEFDPHNPGTVYASGGGVFKSIDGGDHWSPSGLSDSNTYDLAFDPWTSGTSM